MPVRLPGVLAMPLDEYFRETDPVLRLHHLCDAVEILSKLLTVVALVTGTPLHLPRRPGLSA